MQSTFIQKFRTLASRIFHEFSDDNCPVLAGAVAYFGIFSVFPAMLLILAVMGAIYGDEVEAETALTSFVADYLPGAVSTARSLIVKLVDSHGILNGVAVVGLLWAGSQVLFYLEVAMNHAWDCPPRAWWKSRLRSVGLLLLTQALVAGYLFLSVMGVVKSFIERLPGYEWLSAEVLLDFALWAVPFLLSLAMFVSLNRFLPNCNVSWRAAFCGGAFTALLFEMARWGFRFYLNSFARYDVLYGSIGGLFIIVMWAYYGALITLIGAELASEVEAVVWEVPRCEVREPEPE